MSHTSRGTGAVYVRSSKGNEPVDDHRTLLEPARRGEEAEARARRRLVELSAGGYALRPSECRICRRGRRPLHRARRPADRHARALRLAANAPRG
jgi:hypothetical protein